MKACCAALARTGGHPPARLQHLRFGVFLDGRFTGLTQVVGRIGLSLDPAQALKAQPLLMRAMRARHHEVTLIRLLVLALNAGGPGNRGRGDDENLSARKGSGPGLSQGNRIAFAFHIAWITVNLVQEQVAHRHGAQTHCAVGTGEHQHPTAKLLGQDRVAGITRAGRGDQGGERLAFFDQRVNALLGVALGHLHRGGHRHHRARSHVNHIANPVVARLSATDLRPLHEHHALDRRGWRKAIHDLAQVRRARRAPAPRL